MKPSGQFPSENSAEALPCCDNPSTEKFSRTQIFTGRG